MFKVFSLDISRIERYSPYKAEEQCSSFQNKPGLLFRLVRWPGHPGESGCGIHNKVVKLRVNRVHVFNKLV